MTGAVKGAGQSGLKAGTWRAAEPLVAEMHPEIARLSLSLSIPETLGSVMQEAKNASCHPGLCRFLVRHRHRQNCGFAILPQCHVTRIVARPEVFCCVARERDVL